jgi:hypothetical protein
MRLMQPLVSPRDGIEMRLAPDSERLRPYGRDQQNVAERHDGNEGRDEDEQKDVGEHRNNSFK